MADDRDRESTTSRRSRRNRRRRVRRSRSRRRSRRSWNKKIKRERELKQQFRMEAKRTRTRRGLHYQIERLTLLLPLLLLLQTCFRFRLQCPSEIVEEAAQIQEFGPSLDIKLSTCQAIKRQQSKPSAQAEAEAFSLISFGFPILRIPIGQALLAGGHNFALKIHQIFPVTFEAINF